MRYAIVLALLLSACAVGPDYVRPKVETPAAYKEAGDWKPARPRDDVQRGEWWKAFGDPQLDALVERVAVSNQTVAATEAQLRQAEALTAQARAAWWPTLTATAQDTRSKPSGTTGPVVGVPTTKRVIYSLPFNVSWEADLWGRIRRTVEQGTASEQASAADLLNAVLSARASLAQSYFQLRTLDAQQQLLDETAANYATTLELTKNRYVAGVASRADVAQAQAQLESTRAQALDTGVQRAQLEHAVAVLLGRPASSFTLAAAPLAAAPPPIPPTGVPADLLERRPDIAAAERRAAAANAEIGVAKAAFFPTLTLAATYGFQSATPEHWITMPSRFWSLGPALALTLFDGGRRAAVSDQAMAAYDQAVANYRGTVLQAFSEVEDNLAALRILEQEAAVLEAAVAAAQQAYDVTLNQYKAGIATYLQVVSAQNALLGARLSAVSVRGRRVVASVQLVKALGGGWSMESAK